MAKLLGTERNGGFIDKYWLHTGEDGDDRITVETIEDVEPVFDSVKRHSQTRYSDMQYVASIPQTVVTEICKTQAPVWGLKPHEVLAELVQNKTDRAQRVWRMLTQSREYRKLQAKAYR